MATTTHRRKTTSRRDSSRRGIFARIGGQGPWWAKTLRWLLFLLVFGIVAGALTFFVLYRAIAIPDANADFQTQTTKVYYDDGKTLLGEFATQDRESVSLDEVSENMQAAVIAAEDRTFYENRGIDFRGIIRAARDNARSGEITGGGSTITQQYVKVLYLSQDRSYQRKIREAVLSVKIHNQLSKEQILEGYLNTIYFGNGAYGVEVAAQTYFDRPASELTPAQSALLATIINSPTYYDPYAEGALDRIMPRFGYVMDGMLEAGAIDQAERDKWQERFPTIAEKRESERFGGTRGYLLEMVQKELAAQEFSESEILGGGLRITTTFSQDLQRDAVDAVRNVVPQDLDELNVGLVSVEPGTGDVKALYGGPDYLESQLNWATSGVQPGSTFKVFAVMAALEDGYSLQTRLNGNSPIQVGGGTVANQGDSGGRSYGTINLEQATEDSVNTAFIDITQQMAGGPDADIAEGTKKIRDAAEQAGIPTSVLDSIDPNAAVYSLGFAPVPAVDMANAYATLAAGGERAEWHVVTGVKGANGDDLPLPERTTEKTVPDDVVADTLAALQTVVTRGSGTNGQTICPTAGKTGTATAGEGDSQHVSSSWFVGTTPKLATAVTLSRGVGNEDIEGYLPTFFGGQFPALTFSAFMNPALEGTECGSFPARANIQAEQGSIIRPTPVCGDGEVLNSSRTGCVARPEPTPTETTPRPTPTETTAEPEPEPSTPVTCPDGSQVSSPEECPIPDPGEGDPQDGLGPFN